MDQFAVRLNVPLLGSKGMTKEEGDIAEATLIPQIRVLITSANDEVVLIDQVVGTRKFSTGSVGYALHYSPVFFKVSE